MCPLNWTGNSHLSLSPPVLTNCFCCRPWNVLELIFFFVCRHRIFSHFVVDCQQTNFVFLFNKLEIFSGSESRRQPNTSTETSSCKVGTTQTAWKDSIAGNKKWLLKEINLYMYFEADSATKTTTTRNAFYTKPK